jgi:hypothetical protein
MRVIRSLIKRDMIAIILISLKYLNTMLSRYSGHSNARPNSSLYREFIMPSNLLFFMIYVTYALLVMKFKNYLLNEC